MESRILPPPVDASLLRLQSSSYRAGRRNAESDQEQNVPLDLSPVAGGPLAGQEGQRAVARSLELTVGHLCDGVRGGGLSSCVVSLSRRSACGLFRDGGSLREWPVRRRRAPKLSRLGRPPC